MPRRSYPLLDIAHALQEADSALEDALFYLDTLGHTGDAPDEADTLTTNLKTLRYLLRVAVPPRIMAAIAQEQAGFAACQQYVGQPQPGTAGCP